MLIGHQSYGQDYNEDSYGNPIVNDTVFLPELPITNSYTDVDNTPDIYLQYSHLISNTGNYCLLCTDDDDPIDVQTPITTPVPAPIVTPGCWYCDENNNYIGVGVNYLPPLRGGSAYVEYHRPGHYGYIIDFCGSEGYGSGYADICILYGINGKIALRVPIKEVRDLAYLMSAADEKYHFEFYKFVQLNPVVGLKILKAYTASVNKEDAFINNIALALIAGNADISVTAAAIIIPRIIQYYYYELERLRLENPGWSEFKLKSTAALNLFQTGLDVIGLIPVIGEIPDLVNGGIYLVRGDLLNASISALAIIPIGGQAATGSRLVIKIVDGVAVPIAKGADEVAALAARIAAETEAVWKLSAQKLGRVPSGTTLGENLISFGKNRPINSHAHHITAGGASNVNAASARAILQREGIDINEAANGVFLPSSSKYAIDEAVPHANVHTNLYYEKVFERLEAAQPGKVREELQKIADELLNGTFPY
ncbi:AHH domain-containing protein [Flavobacterium flavigenum]|uniref:AHH domain-containing protein n=1 Tax=Flavobacterium flavigenum TaxID=3003258 RepID=UPI002482D01E|nr:AHH domain-containing protein [Flavobacterium flavigenum]